MALGGRELFRSIYLKLVYFPLFGKRCPPSFRSWRGLPCRELAPSAASFLPPPGPLPDLIFLPMVDWHAPRQRSQQLARAFRNLGHRCIYLNPHFGRELPRPALLDSRPVVTALEPGIVELHTPLRLEPVFHHRALSATEGQHLSDAVERTLRIFGTTQAIFVASLPTWEPLLEALRSRRSTQIVVDCHDLLRGFGNFAPELIEAEWRMLEHADLAIFSSASLLDEHIARHPQLSARAQLVRNAVQPEDFAAAAGLRSRDGRPFTVGYTGACSDWLDFELLRAAARRRPDWRFRIIGRLGDGVSPNVFAGLPNLEYIPQISYEQLPGHLAGFDAAIIPFQLTPLTLATNPLKLYEYFACGLPVVSTRLPEVERYGNLVYTATGHDEFLAQLDRAAAELDPTLRTRRQQVAANETWPARCHQILHALDRLQPTAAFSANSV